MPGVKDDTPYEQGRRAGASGHGSNPYGSVFTGHGATPSPEQLKQARKKSDEWYRGFKETKRSKDKAPVKITRDDRGHLHIFLNKAQVKTRDASPTERDRLERKIADLDRQLATAERELLRLKAKRDPSNARAIAEVEGEIKMHEADIKKLEAQYKSTKDADRQAYRGYLITVLRDGSFEVSKDNHHIINCKTLQQAKKEIDGLV